MISPEENVALLIGSWQLMASRLPRGSIQRNGGVASLFANEPLQFFNVSVLERNGEFQCGLSIATERAAGCPYPSYVATSESWLPPEWDVIALQAGWTPAFHLTAMDAQTLLPARNPIPDLEFRRVSNASTATDLATINAHAYGLPIDLFDCIFNMDLWHASSFAFVGYTEGEAVTTAAIHPVAGTGYAAFVATMPSHQGKGHAEAALRHTITSAGLKRITMHATDAGRPLYQSMGFLHGDRAVVLTREH